MNQTEEGTQWKGAIPLEKKDEEFFSGTRVCGPERCCVFIVARCNWLG